METLNKYLKNIILSCQKQSKFDKNKRLSDLMRKTSKHFLSANQTLTNLLVRLYVRNNDG